MPPRFPLSGRPRFPARLARTMLSCSMAALSCAATAQSLVRDMAPGNDPTRSSVVLRSARVHGSELFLTVGRDDTGFEPWWSDGTVAGSRLLVDIVPGTRGSEPTWATALGSVVLFATSNISYLWRTDGTSSNTTRVAGPFRFGGEGLFPWNNALWFVARDAYSGGGYGLWRTDGTVAGTVEIASGFAQSTRLTAVGNRLFLASWSQLWVSDGTPAGTTRVASFRDIDALVDLGGTALMLASDSSTGRELWVSDGTGAGTRQVLDLLPGSGGQPAGELHVLQGRAYFAGDDGIGGDELWSTDGSAAGTKRVVDLVAGPGSSAPRSMFAADSVGRLYFSATDTSGNRELWLTDGTAAGTVLVDLGPGGNFSDPRHFADLGGRVFFSHNDYFITGWEPWVSQGSPDSTRPLGDLLPGTGSSYPTGFQSRNAEVVFRADGKLWVTDGTAANTRVLLDLFRPRPDSFHPLPERGLGGLAWFRGIGAGSRELWTTAGTGASTSLLLRSNDYLVITARLGDRMLVVGDHRELLAVDERGTATSLATVHNSPPSSGIQTYTFVVAGGRAFFVADDLVHGPELWVTDGTAAGTGMVLDIRSRGDSEVNDLVALGDRILFGANDGVHGRELWTSDGTTAGTRMVRDIRTGAASGDPSWPCELDGFVLFAARDDIHGRELWRSDGTAAGTVLVRDIEPAVFAGNAWSSSPTRLTRMGDSVFFAATTAPNDTELWRSDGTAQGTSRVFDVPNGSLMPDKLVASRNALFFAGFEPAYGFEPWVSDGTPGGTRRIRDIRPGPMHGVADIFPAGAAHVAIVAEHLASGRELWISDGTAAGTGLLVDVVPGPGSSSPYFVRQIGDHLYWSAYALDSGRELWSAPLRAFGGAATEVRGVGCGSPRGVPEIGSLGVPVVGSPDFSLTVKRAAPRTYGIVAMDLAHQALPLGSGCSLLVGLGGLWSGGWTDALGRLRLPVPLPNDPRLSGTEFWAQAAFLDAGGALWGTATMTPALWTIVGQ